MTQHISVRVPWHDHDWDGTVCRDPEANNSCLRLKNIAENRDDKTEASICGRCMADYAGLLSCIGEGAGFMSPHEMVRTVEHPYKASNPETHGHYLPTELTYPAYSFPARPFLWLMREEVERKKDALGISYDASREPTLNFATSWVQDARNHKAIFDCFYQDVVEDKSLVLAYAKQAPFVEDTRRVVVAVGHVAKVIPAIEYDYEDDRGYRSMIWETMICHSIREDHTDGFVIPYRQMMEYAETHPDFDMSSITVFAPDDAFEQFSYATEHVTHDAVIDVLQSCVKAFEIINSCLDEDYSNVLSWLNQELENAWEDRGAFPGLGPMLCSLEITQGMLVAKSLQDGLGGSDDVWERLDACMRNPAGFLDSHLAQGISPIVQAAWRHMPDERKNLFRLLSRLSLTIEQARVLFYQDEREKHGVKCTDQDIIENPYVLYEQTRLLDDGLRVSVKKVDRTAFPVPSVRECYPLDSPTALSSDNDERRVRAIAVQVLEDEAQAGNTIVPCNVMAEKIRGLVIDPECKVTSDMLSAIDKFLRPQILRREMKDGTEYYKLMRINEFDMVVEKRIRKRIRASKLEVSADWRGLLDAKFDKGEPSYVDPKSDEGRARREKAAALEVLASSRISALVGNAGTGKTTVLSVLCSHPQVRAGGVLLLAPTGKATVRLLESMGDTAKDLTALNVAQFLMRSKRFDWKTMRYRLSAVRYRDVPETVIVDESSMLTEEMFGALVEALGSAKRIVFVGDPNQLPPIGAGRPFVDLVNLLRLNLDPGEEVKTCANYAELTVNRRQKADEVRLDVELSKVFTDTEDSADDVISEIEQGLDSRISIERWSTKEELEELLLKTVAAAAHMDGVDDQWGFDKSLGGEKAKYETFFNVGAAAKAEDWQVLAPVRNMPHGVMNINRLLHQKYREHLLEVSKRTRWRKIPKAFGPESIIYGDKVINVVNDRRDGWPKDACRNYVANGEIGIACSCYGSKAPKRYLKVEFSSQAGATYSFTSSDFGDEGTPSLELAYALTVHKAQGSQFNMVILVIAEPCRITSREMLYTALTRQVERIVILYNEEPYHLLKYASAENSDIARRFTDLFADVFHDGEADMRPQIVEVDGKFYEDRLVHRTARGELVRSKSEVIIANALHAHGLDYVYEPELVLEGRVKRPDFKVLDEDTGDEWYWEHCGMMDDPKYRKRWEEKRKFYEKNGIVEGKNLIVTYDERGALDSHRIEEIIEETFDW